MGMFDYLTPPVAKALLQKLYDLLQPRGAIVVGNYHASNPSRYYMAYWLDWVLYYRTEAEMLELTAPLAGAKSSILFDESGSQMFLKVERP
jgi:extracellular factor (EF) 3-hydroxypalmitic acid methyl ester biosynthesis protein